MTLPCLVVAWLGGAYLESILQAPARILGLALPLFLAVSLLWWRETRVRLGAACGLFLLLGALRYTAAVPTFDQDDPAYYNDQGTVTMTGVVVEVPDVRDRYVNLKVLVEGLDVDGEYCEVVMEGNRVASHANPHWPGLSPHGRQAKTRYLLSTQTAAAVQFWDLLEIPRQLGYLTCQPPPAPHPTGITGIDLLQERANSARIDRDAGDREDHGYC
jgi:hypothetical protein